MRYIFPVTVKQDKDGRWLVTFPDVPEALTDGVDKNEALREAANALGVALAGYVHEQREIPAPSQFHAGQQSVCVPPLVAAKLALYQTMNEQSVTNVKLAHRLGVSEAAVRRLVNPDHSSKIEKVEAALLALGKHLIVEAA
jgi:antitoxin HicB